LGENSGPISPRLDTSKLLKLIIWCKKWKGMSNCCVYQRK
jgi:hypothetical protein